MARKKAEIYEVLEQSKKRAGKRWRIIGGGRGSKEFATSMYNAMMRNFKDRFNYRVVLSKGGKINSYRLPY